MNLPMSLPLFLLWLFVKWALTWNWALIGKVVFGVVAALVLGAMGAADERDKRRLGL